VDTRFGLLGRATPDGARAEPYGFGKALPGWFDRCAGVHILSCITCVFDANESLAVQRGDRLNKRGGKVFDIAPTLWTLFVAMWPVAPMLRCKALKINRCR